MSLLVSFILKIFTYFFISFLFNHSPTQPTACTSLMSVSSIMTTCFLRGVPGDSFVHELDLNPRGSRLMPACVNWPFVAPGLVVRGSCELVDAVIVRRTWILNCNQDLGDYCNKGDPGCFTATSICRVDWMTDPRDLLQKEFRSLIATSKQAIMMQQTGEMGRTLGFN